MQKLIAILLATSMMLGTAQLPVQANLELEQPEGIMEADEEIPYWTLVWSDEFEGGEGPNYHNGLDLSVWEIQTGNGATMGLTGWGNGEIQYYTGDNVWVEDGMLHIEARRETTVSPSEGTFHYTSGRIRSVGTEGIGTGMSVRYGRIEASISLPYGAGLWPAFWMMPTYDVYGTWAASGEIDIMEVRGREPFYSTSAIHYGGMWPHNTYSHSSVDLRTIDPDLTINSFVQYAVEWEPGEMRFLINDEVFWTVNDWHALVHGHEEMGVSYMFPAPFDQYFHVLLNLAIGGWFDGGVEPDEDLFDEARLMRVEYVRVYELTGRPMRDPVPPTIEPEEIPAEAKQMIAPGGQIWDVNFENVIHAAPLPGDAGFPTRDGWELFSGPFGGAISGYHLTDGMMHVQIAAAGGPVYANQLMQRVSLVRGRHYRLEFDARAAAPRLMNARLSQGANPGWTAYTNFNPSLTTDTQSFTHYFTMTGATNLDARLEFNMGASAHDIWIGNVSLVEVPYVPEGADVLRTPLPNGNMVWNGTFDQGSDGLIFWGRAGANFAVNPERQLRVTNIPADAAPEDVMLYQTRIPFANDTFRLTFDANSTGNVGFRILNMNDNTLFYNHHFTLTGETMVHEFTLSGIANDSREMQIQFLLGEVENELTFDNVRIERLTTTDRDFTGVSMHLIDNGDFFAGLRSWEHVSTGGGVGSTTVANGIATISATTLGTQPWSVMVMNNGSQVHSGFTYAVEFDVSATVDRNIQLVVETPAFTRRVDEIITVGEATQTHRFEFTAAHTEILDLKFLTGAMTGAAVGDVHISNVQFYVVGAPLERIPTFVADTTNNFVGEAVTLAYNTAGSDFSTAAITIEVAGRPATFTHTVGAITLDARYFATAVTYRIDISAEGYEGIVLYQPMREREVIDGDGNLLVNGDFTQPLTGPEGGWWYAGQNSALFTANWLAWLEASYRVLAGGGIAVDLPNGGYLSWHVMLHQPLAEVLPTGEYALTFTARSTRDRTALLEFGPAGPLQQQTAIELTADWETFTIPVTSAAFVRFLLGHVEEGAHLHTVYIRDVQLRAVEEVVDEVNMAALEALINGVIALELNEADFTAESWSVFAFALSQAQAVLANEAATQAEVDAAVETLLAALVGLEEVEDESDDVDKTALIALIASVEALALVEADFTAESWSVFAGSLANAQAVLANEAATQVEVDAAMGALLLALVGLEAAVEEEDGVNTDLLEALLAEIALLDLNEADFTTESWSVFAVTLAQAQAVLANEAATQAEVDAAVEALLAALVGLEAVVEEENGVNTDLLVALLNEIMLLDLNEADFTAESWLALVEVVAHATALLANEEATQEQVDAAVAALLLALANLEASTDDDGSGDDNGSTDDNGAGDDNASDTDNEPDDDTDLGDGKQPTSPPRPTTPPRLPQTGAITGSTLFGGLALAALGLTLAFKKEK